MITWSSQIIKQSVYSSLGRNQKINHFPKSYEITRKDLFYHRIAKAIALHGEKSYDFVPKTYTYP
jgi:tubulin polyglutamylase TTLL5